ncbi:hypothetical protein EDB19DRAFT_1826921 [Suillus lakei]|nr:hypothetical protein EDB19DRAFT_1826921 [Suillus lakei]
MSTPVTMMVVGSEDTIPFDSRLIIGPMQIGALVTAALFGCIVIQSYVYFTKFVDSLGFKATVKSHKSGDGHRISIWTRTVMLTLWAMTVTAYDDPSELNVLPGIAMTSLTRFVVEQTDTITITVATRAICDITIAVGVTWSPLQKRKRGIVEYWWRRYDVSVCPTNRKLNEPQVSVLQKHFFANALLASLNRRLVLRKEGASDNSIAMNPIMIRVDVIQARVSGSHVKTQDSFH